MAKFRKISGWKPRNIPRGIVILCIAVLIIIGILFFFSFKLKFALKDELILILTPLHESYTVPNNASLSLNFTLTADNFVQCKTACILTFAGISEGKDLSSESILLGHDQTITRSFVIPLPGKGSGQYLYTFEAECANQKSFLCMSDGKSRYKSSFITVNYDLREDEAAIKPSLKEGIESWQKTLANATAILQQADILNSRLPGRFDEQRSNGKKISTIKARITNAKAQRDSILQSWGEEQYFSTAEAFAKADTLSDINMSLDPLMRGILATINAYNANLGIMRWVIGQREPVVSAAAFFHAEPSTVNNDRLMRLQRIIYAVDSLSHADNVAAISKNLTTQRLLLSLFITDDNLMEKRSTILSAYGYSLLSLKNVSNMTVPHGSCSDLRSILASINKDNNDTLTYLSAQNLTGADSHEQYLFKAAAAKEAAKILNESPASILEYLNLNSTDETLPNDRIPAIIIDRAPIESIINAHCRNNDSPTLDFNSSFLETDLSAFKDINGRIPFIQEDGSFDIPDQPALCCDAGECKPCCEGACTNYPLMFIHGHTFSAGMTPEYSANVFSPIQRKMAEDGYINAGELYAASEDIPHGDWGRIWLPVSVRSSYYYLSYFSVGEYRITAQKTESIENYALRLREMIDTMKLRTGQPKVNIIAHSMGGLVTREYLALFGTGSVDKVILINTPNQGISQKAKDVCSIFGSDRECSEMLEGSIFLDKLNSNPIYGNLYVIRSSGCQIDGKDGDGIVTAESAFIRGAKNYQINGTCTGAFGTDLHADVLDPGKYPEVYSQLLQILHAK